MMKMRRTLKSNLEEGKSLYKNIKMMIREVKEHEARGKGIEIEKMQKYDVF